MYNQVGSGPEPEPDWTEPMARQLVLVRIFGSKEAFRAGEALVAVTTEMASNTWGVWTLPGPGRRERQVHRSGSAGPRTERQRRRHPHDESLRTCHLESVGVLHRAGGPPGPRSELASEAGAARSQSRVVAGDMEDAPEPSLYHPGFCRLSRPFWPLFDPVRREVVALRADPWVIR
jgi:hypothetical protein